MVSFLLDRFGSFWDSGDELLGLEADACLVFHGEVGEGHFVGSFDGKVLVLEEVEVGEEVVVHFECRLEWEHLENHIGPGEPRSYYYCCIWTSSLLAHEPHNLMDFGNVPDNRNDKFQPERKKTDLILLSRKTIKGTMK